MNNYQDYSHDEKISKTLIHKHFIITIMVTIRLM